MNRYIFIGLLCFVIGACTHHTTGFYEGPRYLSFVNEKGADTAFISFANYPGASTHEVAFVLKLTGNIPEEDLTYRLEVVDSLTTAGTTDYQLPEHLVFRKDRVTDTLVVTVMNSNPLLTEQTLSVGLRIVANEHFRPGWATKSQTDLYRCEEQAGMVEGRIGVLDIGRVFIQKNGGVYLVHRGEYPGRGRTFCCQSVYLTI